MTSNLIALNKIDFWAMCVVAVIMLVPLTHAAARQWILACLNLTFMTLLLRGQALGVISATMVAYLLLQGVGRERCKWLFTSLAGLCVLGLFILHKLPAIPESVGMTRVGQILALIGFSYVALRMIELLRTVWERRHPAPDFPSTINYLLPFHMLAAGPIQAYDEFIQQPAVPKLGTPRDVLAGMERIAAGAFKKFVLAFILQKVFLTDFQSNGIFFFMEIQVFFLWLYLDFSAYSDIAVGVGNLIGVATPENFNRPLLARNMIDFWERWHMSLSLFIRRNLFIPIQMFLMRRTDARWPLLCAVVAVAISFVLCGLWHGLSIAFLTWGVVQASGLVVTHLYGHFLKQKLGTKRLKAYRANPWIRGLANCVTYEFQALASLTLFMG